MPMEIQIEFISSNALAPYSGDAKISFILSNIKKDKILVLDDGLSSREQSSLISETMKSINSRFPGIEISTLGVGIPSDDVRSTLIKMLGGKTGGMTVIGPSKLVKQIKSDPDKIRLLAGRAKKRK